MSSHGQLIDLTADVPLPALGRIQRAGKNKINYAADPYGGLLDDKEVQGAGEEYEAPEPAKKAAKKRKQTSKIGPSSSSSSSSSSSTSQAIDFGVVTETAGEVPEAEAEAEADVEGGEEDAPEYLMGSSRKVKCVGTQYYSGVCHVGEYVNLVREPNNPYDHFAIRVENLRGDKVGHINRHLAAVLSPMIDAAASKYGNLRIEASVKDELVYSLTLQFDYYTNGDSAFMAQLQSRGQAGDLQAASASSSSVVVSKHGGTHRGNRSQHDLDALLSELEGLQSSLPPFHESAAPAVKTTLYDHQREGVAWMLHRENDPDNSVSSGGLPPFWKIIQEKGKNVFFNDITNSTRMQRPQSVRGGLLCDDMGLGKSLQVLTTIAANRGSASGSDSASPRGTLIVCPVSVLNAWEEQISSHLAEGSVQVHTYAGAARNRNVAFLASMDIVLVSYATLALDFRDPQPAAGGGGGGGGGTKRKRAGGLFDVQWRRIVLDEAHNVRNRKTRAARAVLSLQALFRWGLTGTLIMNTADDVQPLLAFLQAEPLADHAIWNRAVGRPIKEGMPEGLARLRLLRKTSPCAEPRT